MLATWLTIAQIIAATGGIGGVVSLALYRYQRRKLRADASGSEMDAAKVLSDSALALLEPYRQQIKDLQHELVRARRQVADLRTELAAATRELDELRHGPSPAPEHPH